MRRPLAALLAASLALGAAVLVTPALSSASGPGRPHVSKLITPTKGIAITLGYANTMTDAHVMVVANELMSMISTRLHANAVSLNFPFWASGSSADNPQRAPMTPSPQRLMAITAIAHRYHLRVQWRPYLFEGDLKYQTRPSIFPKDPRLWLKNYWQFLQPYLEYANLAGAASFSVALELRSMLPYLSSWTQIVRRAKAEFSGQLFYSQQHIPQVSLPLTARGYDAYQPIALSSYKLVSIKSFAGGFEHNLKVAEMQSSPADLTLEEISVPAAPYAYQRPAFFHYPKGTAVDRPLQTDWFTGACDAFWSLHLQGIYFFAINFSTFKPTLDQNSSIYGWVGTPSQTAIAKCFERSH